MSPYDWNKEIADLHRRMNRWFELLSPRRVSSCFSGEHCWVPSADIHETDGAYHVIVDLAGVDPSSIEMTIHGHTLDLSGSRLRPHIDSCIRIHQLEIDFGMFRRRFHFPLDLDTDQAGSSCEQGMLQITLPKLKPPQPVKVPLRTD